jgi:hypothetical protein
VSNVREGSLHTEISMPAVRTVNNNLCLFQFAQDSRSCRPLPCKMRLRRGAANFACDTTSRAFGELGKCKNRLITLKTWDDCNWQGMTLLEQFSYLFDDNVVSEVWEGRAEPVSDTGRLD